MKQFIRLLVVFHLSASASRGQVLTEIGFFGQNSDVLEIKNTSATAIEASSLKFVVGGITATPTRTGVIAAGGTASFGGPATTGTTYKLNRDLNVPNTGGVVAIKNAAGVVVDRVNFGVIVEAGPVANSTFPAARGVSLQLDPGKTTASANDLGSSWCLSFKVANTLGAPNHKCGGSVRLNELFADVWGPTQIVDDADGLGFVEVKGPPGALLEGLVLHDNAQLPPPRELGAPSTGVHATDFADFALSGRLPISGIAFLADLNSNGASHRALAKAQWKSLHANVNSTGALELKRGAVVQDSLGHPEPEVSASRNDQGGVYSDPSPTPGVPNDEVRPRIVSSNFSEWYADSSGLYGRGFPNQVYVHDVVPLHAPVSFAGVGVPSSQCYSAHHDPYAAAPSGSVSCMIQRRATAVVGDLVVGNARKVSGFTYLGPAEAFQRCITGADLTVAAGDAVTLTQILRVDGATGVGGTHAFRAEMLISGPEARQAPTLGGDLSVAGRAIASTTAVDRFQTSFAPETPGQYLVRARFSRDGGLRYATCDDVAVITVQ